MNHYWRMKMNLTTDEYTLLVYACIAWSLYALVLIYGAIRDYSNIQRRKHKL